jgi:hypothetical protein
MQKMTSLNPFIYQIIHLNGFAKIFFMIFKVLANNAKEPVD